MKPLYVGEDRSIHSVHHNLRHAGAREDTEADFEVEYIHEARIKLGDFYEIKIDDFGVTDGKKGKILAIGFGTDRIPFLRGIYVDSKRNICKRGGTGLDSQLGMYAIDEDVC